MSLCDANKRFLSSRSSDALFEPLEERRVFDAGPTPGDGNDYIFLAAGHDDPVSAVQPLSVPAQVAPQTQAFQWLDGTRPTHITTLSGGTIAAVHVDGWSMFPRDANHNITSKYEIDEANTRLMARWVSEISDTLVLDIEDWPVDIRSASKAAVDKSIAMFKQVIAWVRDERPQLRLACYGMFPIADMYRSTNFQTSMDLGYELGGWWSHELINAADGYAKWQAANDYLRPILDDVDFIAPSLYTRTNDVDGLWSQFAVTLIEESRRYGKPVIPFVWYRYHNVVPGLGRVPIDTQTLLKQLDLVRAHADGVIMWAEGDYELDEAWVGTYIDRAAQDDEPSSPPPVEAAFNAAPLFPDADVDDSDDDDNEVSPLLALLH